MPKPPLSYAFALMAVILLASLGAARFDTIGAIANSIPLFVLAAQVSLVLLAFAFALKGRIPIMRALFDSVPGQARGLAFLIATTAMCGSLFYQFGMNYTPCELCWFQRIFMYPLPFILGVALIRKRPDASEFALPLCAIGLVIAAYHYYIQFVSVASFACSATGSEGSCSVVQTAAFGYMTIPLMSLTAFVSIAVLLWMDRKKGAANSSPAPGTST